MTNPVLNFTGERFTPECVREICYEHWHRYAFAASLAKGRRILDAACGEGYGSALLAGIAANVTGVDLAREAIEHARERYGGIENLQFLIADCTALEELPDASFDLITSFETLEHVAAQEAMLEGFARLLAPQGLLLISTPDRRTYSDLSGFHNEYHVRELYRDEFEALLSPRFLAYRLYGQKLAFQSALWSLTHSGSWTAATLDTDGSLLPDIALPPLYFLAVCAHDAAALSSLPALSLFGDAGESVYAHYNDEIRKGIAAGHRILELERELQHERVMHAALRRQLDSGS